MLPSDLRDLMQQMEWADAQVWSAVLAAPRAHDDPRMRELLHHIHGVQWAYLQVWRGEPVTPPDLASFPDLAAIREWGRGFHAGAAEWLAGVSADALGSRVDFPWTEYLVQAFGEVHPATLAQTLLQVPSHSAYHRGQVNARLRELGGEPPTVDFIVWVWRGQPAPSWEDAAVA